MTTKNPPVDKARQQAMAKMDRVLKDLDEQLGIFGPDRDRTEASKEVKALKAKVDA
jgi:hypothetical protein